MQPADRRKPLVDTRKPPGEEQEEEDHRLPAEDIRNKPPAAAPQELAAGLSSEPEPGQQSPSGSAEAHMLAESGPPTAADTLVRSELPPAAEARYPHSYTSRSSPADAVLHSSSEFQ